MPSLPNAPFARASLRRKDRKDSGPVEFMFNPTQFTLDRANQIAEVGVPGLGAPILQYVRGMPRTISLELLFDTYERPGESVAPHTSRIYKLLAIDGSTHAPPICEFKWGTFTFDCVLERVSGRFTLFRADGTPVRATLNVALKEFVEVGQQVREDNMQSADHTKARVVRRGESLSSIAAAEYGDAAKWRPIAAANGIDNPRRIAPGRQLVIPPLRGDEEVPA